MIYISFYDLLFELAQINGGQQIIIEIGEYNTFASKLRAQNINCLFSYRDIEDYAEQMPEVFRIETSQIIFMPNPKWMGFLENMSNKNTSLSKVFKDSWNK